MDRLVRVNGQLVRLKTSADMRSSVVWAIGIFVAGNLIAIGAFGIGQIAREPAPVDSWFAVTRPAASASLQAAPPEAIQWAMRLMAALFAAFSCFMLFVALPVEFKLQREARAALGKEQTQGPGRSQEETAMSHCVRCGCVLRPPDRFCESCGTPVAAAVPAVCPRCQASYRPGAAFCGSCGLTIGAGTSAPPLAYAAPMPAAAPVPPGWPPPGAAGGVAPAAPYSRAPTAVGVSGGWKIAAGYLLAVLGGIFGLAIGGHLWRATTVGPMGQKVPRYNSSTRTHGKIVLAIAAFATAFWLQIQR